MTYQERQVVIFPILIGMLLLVTTYIIGIIVGLLFLSPDLKGYIRPVELHTPKLVLLDKEKIPVTFREPPVLTKQAPVVDEDVKLLAQIINAEAGNQPYNGKIAVGNVVMNRVESPKFPDTIKDVIYQKGQFSPVSDGSIHKTPNTESVKAAQEVLHGRRVVSKDVLFYYNPEIATSSWIFTRKVVARIGEHAFTL
jgi:N-acetylmuramoyl-L-alanine amidase